MKAAWPPAGITTGRALLAVPLLAVAALGIAACSDTNPTSPTSAATTPTTAAADTAPPLGTPQRFGDPSNGAELTILKVAHVTPSANPPNPLDPGRVLIGTEIRVTNIGAAVRTDQDMWNMRMTSADGQTIDRLYWDTAITDGRLLGSYRLRTGQSLTGWIVHQIPAGTTPAYVNIPTPAGDVLEWKVPTGALPAASPTGEATK